MVQEEEANTTTARCPDQDQINTIQKQPIQDQDHSLEAKLIAQYEENMTKLTEFYRQRAKKHQAVHGDRNTSYFHNDVLKRRHRNHIVSIKEAHGNNLFDPNDIAHEFVHYFKTIFHCSCSNNGRPYLNNSCPHDAHDFTNSIPARRRFGRSTKQSRNIHLQDLDSMSPCTPRLGVGLEILWLDW